jgi:hypothetical protein
MMGSLALPHRFSHLVDAVVDRHRVPASTATHPRGVIVPNNELMTERIKDPAYSPYCVVNDSCGRVRRTGFGFQCGKCGNRMNYDTTPFNGNVDVQYEKNPEDE